MAHNFYGGMPGRTGDQGIQGIQGPAIEYAGSLTWIESEDQPEVPDAPHDYSFFICNKITAENAVLNTYFIIKDENKQWQWVEIFNASMSSILNITGQYLQDTTKDSITDLYNAWYINKEFDASNSAISAVQEQANSLEANKVAFSNISGNILSEEYLLRTTKVSAAEDIEDLQEGSILWTYGELI